jgi:hypothetical protein
MKKPNIEKIESEEEKAFRKKMKRKKPAMKVSGAKVKKLADLIGKKAA